VTSNDLGLFLNREVALNGESLKVSQLIAWDTDDCATLRKASFCLLHRHDDGVRVYNNHVDKVGGCVKVSKVALPLFLLWLPRGINDRGTQDPHTNGVSGDAKPLATASYPVSFNLQHDDGKDRIR
jgi:hypothetical protein